MRYTDDALYPENMQPLIITAAPYGPTWLPVRPTSRTWDEQVRRRWIVRRRRQGRTTCATPRPGISPRISNTTP